jgi:N-acetyl sugar amidotransferase
MTPPPGLSEIHPQAATPTQVCANCVMDDTDSAIVFDDAGVCDHCVDFRENVQPRWHRDLDDRRPLEDLASNIRQQGEGSDFDCILGMSGGLDSSYLLHVAVAEMGLRPLVFHVDGGWNSDVAVRNIERLVDGLGVELFTKVINWEEMRDFQLAFFKAGVPHIDIPQDHAFVATLYNFCLEHSIKIILNGGNISTECVRNPLEWLYYGTDMRQLRDIRRQFATLPLDTYPMSSVLRHKLYLRYIRRLEVVKSLNLVDYRRSHAIEVLGAKYGFEYYGQKHFESRFTRFYEAHWLPSKFGFDTRKVQFSSLIVTGQMNRDEAIGQLRRPSCEPDTVTRDFEFVARKLRISESELASYWAAPNKSFRDYKNMATMFNIGAKVLKAIGVERSIKR